MNGVQVGHKGYVTDVIQVRTPTWLDHAACKVATPEDREAAFATNASPGEACGGSPKQEAQRFINRYCTRCPVLEACAQYRDATKTPWGVWGGVLWVDGKPSTRANGWAA